MYSSVATIGGPDSICLQRMLVIMSIKKIHYGNLRNIFLLYDGLIKYNPGAQ